MTRAGLRRLLDALPLPRPGESDSLRCLRWALGDAVVEAQRERMPPLVTLRAAEPVAPQCLNRAAGVDVPMAKEQENGDAQ